MKIFRSTFSSDLRGLSLVELLVVIGVIAILAAFATPAFQSIARGTGVERSGDLVRSQFGLARQSAMARNRPVEVRLYRYRGPEETTEAFRALQLFEVRPDATYHPLGSMMPLPQKMIISSSSTLSTLVDRLLANSTEYGLPSGAPPLPGIANYSGVSFRFRPNGGTDLPPVTSGDPLFYLTLHGETERFVNSRPVNFFTLQIDSLNGSLRSFRP